MKVKEGSAKVGLKLNIQKTKIMASSPITSWQIMGEQWKQWETLFWGLQNHCRLWLQPWNWKTLAPWKKSYDQAAAAAAKLLQSCPTLCDSIDGSPPGSPIPGILQARTLEWVAISFSKLDSILKSRDITLPTKVHLVKAMVFSVVTYGYESWTIRKAEHRIDAFLLCCWRRLLRVPWTACRSNQSIINKSVLNIHWKIWCWSWNSNNLATCCEELTHWKRPWCWERLKAGGEGDNRGLELDGFTDSMNMSLSRLQGLVMDR